MVQSHPLRRSHPATRPGRGPAPQTLHRYRGGLFAGTQSEPAVPNGRDDMMARVEALLWLADEAIAPRKLAAAAGLPDTATARRVINRLQDTLAREGSAFQLEELAGGYQLFTRPEFYPWLARLRATTAAVHLPPALLETLAIIAYRQPVMRADIETIRGVHCGDALRQLLERKLIQTVGRHDSLGRPVLYGTTKTFLQRFGLRTLDDLPPVEPSRTGPVT